MTRWRRWRAWAPTDHAKDVLDGTDNFDFLISGVPNLVGIQDPMPYLPDYHAESDTVDRVNLREEKITEAVAGVLLWGFGGECGTAGQAPDAGGSGAVDPGRQAGGSDESFWAVGGF